MGMEVNKFWLLLLSGRYLLVAVKVTSSIFVNQLNETKPKSSKTQFQFQFELSLAQLSPSLFIVKTTILPTVLLPVIRIGSKFPLQNNGGSPSAKLVFSFQDHLLRVNCCFWQIWHFTKERSQVLYRLSQKLLGNCARIEREESKVGLSFCVKGTH